MTAWLVFELALATAPVCVCEPAPVPTNGARPGEDVDARIERLRTALRLSEAERVVNRKRGR
jgi:hypothetical protein